MNLGPLETAGQAREGETDWAPRRLTMDEQDVMSLVNALLRGCGSAESGMAGVVVCLNILLSSFRLSYPARVVLGEVARN